MGMLRSRVVESKGISGLSVSRVNGFSDGVFAVAITLLVLNIALPSFHGQSTEAKIVHGLGALWPHFFAYALSFVIIGAFWVSHHRMFSHIRRIDLTIVWMNILYLLLVVFIPYTTNLMALYGDTKAATILYAGVLGLAGLMQVLICWYAVRENRLVDEDFDHDFSLHFIRGSLIMSGVFLASIGICFWSPSAAKFFWLLLVITPFIEKWVFDRPSESKAEPGQA
jgi:uncharacterized membrane protein